MTRILLLMAALTAALTVDAMRPGTAAAAQLSYCETWADRVAEHSPASRIDEESRITIRDKAFYECLNMDDEPPLPDNALGLFIDPSSSPFKPLESPPVVTPPQARQPVTPAQEPEPVAQGDADDVQVTNSVSAPPSEDDGQGRGSGKPRGSQEWSDFCTKYYPRSFDPETGTVIPVKLGRRVPCR
ncbi:MAG TPA: hypothetical protein VLQ68_13080 [Rhizobiaceae bacterium]|nr:hypothetical protein [Rhizobiaceae bacterium]